MPLIPEHRVFRLDILDLRDGGVFGGDVAAAEIESGSHGVALHVEHLPDSLRVTRPFEQKLSLAEKSTPTGGRYLMFECPRCAATRRILYLVDSFNSFGCRGCLPLTYEIRNVASNTLRGARARLRSLRSGRRRPKGGQRAHEKRLALAELEVEAREQAWARTFWEAQFARRRKGRGARG